MTWKLPTEFPSLEGAKRIAVDLETYDPDLTAKGPGVRTNGYILGLAVGTDDGFRAYYPIGHKEGPNLDRENVLAWARDNLTRPNQPKVGANILYDLDYLAHAGVNVAGPFLDVQIAEPLLDENLRTYSLDSLAQRYLGETKKIKGPAEYAELRGWKGDPRAHLWKMPSTVVGPYAEGDVDQPLRIIAEQEKLLATEGLTELFTLESKLVPVLLAMRRRGVRVDIGRAEELREELLDRLDETQERLNHIAGREVEVWAADSIAKAFDRANILYPTTPKTGKPSFQAGWLEAQGSDLAQAVVEVRKLDRLVGTFIESAILDNVIGGRIHCQFNQLKSDDSGTVSGRFSSSNPNLQQVPTRDEVAALLRGLFVPDEGQLWGRADYSQIEYRLLAHYGIGDGADTVRAQFNTDPKTDFHQACADMAGIARSPAKNLNFAVVYGAGKARVAAYLGLPLSEAEEFLNVYHGKLPFIKNTYKVASSRASRRGFIRTILGRKRRFDFWESADFDWSKKLGVSRDRTEIARRIKEAQQEAREKGIAPPRSGTRRAYTYKALNSLLQGSSADITKKAMVDCWESGVCDVLGAPLLTVHDELDWSVPDTKAGREAFQESIHLMERAVSLKVPALVDGDLGENWGACK